MNPALKRFHLLRVTSSALLLMTTAAAYGVTVADYAMPFTSNRATDGSAMGITLVSSANFAQSALLVPPGVPTVAATMHRSGNYRDGVSTDFRPQVMTWGQDNRWMLANLRGGLNPTPVQVSSESGVNSVCLSLGFPRDVRDATTTLLFYSLRGPDGICGTPFDSGQADNLVRAISLRDAPGTAPVTLPLVDFLNIQSAYRRNGLLRAIYVFDRGKLLAFTPALGVPREIATGITRLRFHGSTLDGAVVLTIDGNLRLIRSSGVLVNRPLKVASRGFEVTQAVIEGNEVFFVETALDPAARIQGRIYRVPADGSARANVLASTRSPSPFISGVSDSRVVFNAGGFTVGPPPRRAPSELLSVPRAGGPTVRLKRSATGFISVIHVSADKVFYTVTSFDQSAGESTSVAHVSADSGPLVTQFRRGSAWSGIQFGGASDNRFTEVRLLLASNGPGGVTGVRGARLSSFNPDDLSSARLATLNPNDEFASGIGTGPGSIGSVTSVDGNRFGFDVFAFDLFGNRFRRLTNDADARSQFPIP
ncbi:MAG: hypothetical protein ACT4QA_09795 [Panacagrimonas sp.]